MMEHIPIIAVRENLLYPVLLDTGLLGDLWIDAPLSESIFRSSSIRVLDAAFLRLRLRIDVGKAILTDGEIDTLQRPTEKITRQLRMLFPHFFGEMCSRIRDTQPF